MYLVPADKSRETQLRTCESVLSGPVLVDFCRQDEVVVRQSAGHVRPEVDRQLAVGEPQVGVVALGLGDIGDGVGEPDAGHEALEAVGLGELLVPAGADDPPAGLPNRCLYPLFRGRGPPGARGAFVRHPWKKQLAYRPADTHDTVVTFIETEESSRRSDPRAPAPRGIGLQ